jgi:ribose-phosphate pyrophosphokinase
MKVFSGNANPALAESIVAYLDAKLSEAGKLEDGETTLGDIEVTRFPDGETFVKIKENIRGMDVFAVQSICSPPNQHLMELLIMIDAMKRASANRITAVLPFYGYARQDRKDQPRVPITAKLVANLLVAAGANRVLTMDLHAQQIQGFFDIPVDHLHALPEFVRHLSEKQLRDLIVVSPDTGAVKTAYAYSKRIEDELGIECDLAIVAKQRINAMEVEALTLVGEVEGRTCVMVDDLTTTAGTICSAADLLHEHGAREIYAMVSHAPIMPGALERVRDSHLKELIVTDTVPLDGVGDASVTVLSVADLLGEAILRIHENQSVSSLFK